MATFEEQLEAACRDGTIPGCVVCAETADGTFKYARAFGSRKLAGDKDEGEDKDGQANQQQQPYELDSVLRIASCTKLITSIAALQCVEKGLIGLDDDVGTILPRLAEQKVLVKCDEEETVLEDRKNPLTLRLLMTHSGGTQSGFFETELHTYRKKQGTHEQLLTAPYVEERLLMPLAFQPGTAWAYGAGHEWTGKVVEALTGQTLDEYMREHIFGPLGTTAPTFWWRDPATTPRNMAQMTVRDATSGHVVPDPKPWPALPPAECFGGGGLATTMPDYMRVLRSLLRNDGVLLRPETVDAMFGPQLTDAARDSLNATMRAGMNKAGPGEHPSDIDLDWGLGAMLTMSPGSPGWHRGVRCLTWGGMPNLFWFVDREKGICGIFGTQVMPTGDAKTRELTLLWEKDMYKRASINR